MFDSLFLTDACLLSISVNNDVQTETMSSIVSKNSIISHKTMDKSLRKRCSTKFLKDLYVTY